MTMENVPAREVVTDYSKITRNDFPEGFVFGTGTSAYQVEGAAAMGGRGISVWDDLSMRTPDRIADGSNGNVAVDMYHRYKDDIRMMKTMGFDAYRFSISWPRVIPGGKISLGVNRDGIDYYNDLINTVLANGMECHVTLFHWDLPDLLEKEYRGFLSLEIVNDYRNYVDLCFWEFGDRVKHWATFNEPWTYCYTGYVKRTFPPGMKVVYTSELSNAALTSTPSRRSAKKPRLLKGPSPSPAPEDLNDEIPLTLHDYRTNDNVAPPPTVRSVLFAPQWTLDQRSTTKLFRAPIIMSEQDKEAFIAARNLILAHAAAVELYKTKYKDQQGGQIGIVLNNHCFEPQDDTKQEDIDAARRVHDFKFGWFFEPISTGRYPKTMRKYVPREATFLEEESKNLRRNKIDFLGINYYTARYVKYEPNPDPKLVTFDKFQYATVEVNDKNDKPIGTETGPDWLIVVPWGIKKYLKKLNEFYNNPTYNIPPIYITENGVAQPKRPPSGKTVRDLLHDTIRVNYYRDHLGNVLDVINEWKPLNSHQKLEIKGFFAWSWIDNYEWVSGYDARFGIIYADYMNNLKRYPKLSAKWFSQFLAGKIPKILAPGTNAGNKATLMSLDTKNFKWEGEQKDVDDHDEDDYEDEDDEDDDAQNGHE